MQSRSQIPYAGVLAGPRPMYVGPSTRYPKRASLASTYVVSHPNSVVVLDVSINETFFPGSQVLVIWGYFYFFGGFSLSFLILKIWFFPPPKLAKLVEITLEKKFKFKYFLNFGLKNDKKILKKEHCSH
jgi:hypothetical protein